MIWLVYYLILLFVAFVIYMFAIVLHEVGHAIPMYIFTKHEVGVFIGTYGDRNGSYRIKLGKFVFYFSKKRWYYPIGLCSGQNQHLKPFQHIIVSGAGPIFPVIIAAIFWGIVFESNIHGSLGLLSSFFLSVSSMSLLYNLSPSNKPIHLHNGNITYNDGYYIQKYLKLCFIKKSLRGYYYHLQNLIGTDGEANFLHHFDAYTKDGFDNTEMLEHAARIAIGENKYQKAIEYYQLLERKKNLTAEEYSLWAHIENYLGNTDTAKTYVKKALRLNSYDFNAKNLQTDWIIEEGSTKEANELYQKINQLVDKGVDEYKILAQIHTKNGDIEMAIERLEKAIILSPDDDYILILLGISYAKNYDRKKALPIFEKFYSIKKPTANQYINYSAIQLWLGEYTDGIKLLLKALELDHTNRYALNNMADALNHLQRYEDAIDYADKGIAYAPKFGYLYSNKAFSQLMLGMNAEGYATNAIGLELSPQNSYAIRNMGVYYKNTGNLPKAMEYLQKAKELDKTTYMVLALIEDVRILLKDVI